MAKLTHEEIIASLKEMTILELNDLVKAIEEEFGVTAAAPTVVAAAATEEVAQEGPAEVSVIVTNVGTSKVKVIKAVQAITGLGLMDAKKLVDATPAKIKENISPSEAESIKAQLVEAGAEVEVK
ncbi:TPA: 50S ribosomal protein L7/L12 [bacterium]|jgi:large subunit ribosomal protein L7/L12|nr:50S ribosomal protein L7/L12 [bacterium]